MAAETPEPRDIEDVLLRGDLLQIGALIDARRISVRELVSWHLQRIDAFDRGGPGLNAVRELADAALQDAARADDEIAGGGRRGPLHGIAFLVKDNVLTGDAMACAAGARALAGFVPRSDASLVARLRAAGAILLGKTNMTEFADYVSDVMPSGFSGAGGVVKNPHGLEYGRGQGSSVGSAAAVAAGFAAFAIGSETQNSIQTPACHSSVVGFKPSVGMVSRAGVVPLVPSQDSPGPLTRTVGDAALVFDAIAGADCLDTATLHWPHRRIGNRSPVALPALRIGVPRRAMADRDELRSLAPAFDAVLDALRRDGASIVDPCDLPSAEQLLQVRSSVFRTEFKAALNAFLRAHDSPCGIDSLRTLIAWNDARPEAIPYGQSLLLAANETAGIDEPGYRRDRAWDLALARGAGIDAAVRGAGVDALIAPMTVAAKCAGKAGAPVVAIPAGVDPAGSPFGITLFACAGEDQRLLAIAAAVERSIGQRRLPALR
ncbi:MAG TPA: amidase family protein [Burkholderiaceae bacterium]|nr:amidase family protein [Burkholderiaceae bacterium]